MVFSTPQLNKNLTKISITQPSQFLNLLKTVEKYVKLVLTLRLQIWDPHTQIHRETNLEILKHQIKCHEVKIYFAVYLYLLKFKWFFTEICNVRGKWNNRFTEYYKKGAFDFSAARNYNKRIF